MEPLGHGTVRFWHLGYLREHVAFGAPVRRVVPPIQGWHETLGLRRRNSICPMPDITHAKIEEIDAIEGVLEGIKLHRAAAGLGVSSFGISVIELGPGADQYPEHDHSPDGIGGQMFAKRPQQLNQEEVYVALRGSGTLEADGERYALDPDHIVRVGPAVKRKITPGPDGLRLLALGAIPGKAYDPAGTL
jgi:mannose-6-phosphate isomerase-like protein (cupin superfamily)